MKKDSRYEVKFFYSTDQIDKNEWNSIVDENFILNSYEYQSAIEKSGINNFRYGYFMIYEENKLIAHISTGILEFELDMMAGNFIKKITGFVRKIFPNFLKMKVIECGHPTALGNTITLTSKEYFKDVLFILEYELTKLAKREKTSIVAIRDCYPKDLKDFIHLNKKGYKKFQNLPNTFIKTQDYGDFEDYLNDLTAKRRHEIKKHLEIFEKSGCEIVKIEDFSEISAEIEKLWINTFKHSKDYQREILNKDYFSNISKNLGEKSFVFVCKYEGKLIGFTMFIDSGEELISTYCGLDYEYSRDFNIYFVLFYKSVEEAIKLKKRYLELGITNYNPKIEIGAIPEPVYVFSKSTNPFVNLFFVPLMGAITAVPDFNKRNIFNKRHFQREQLKAEVNALWRDKIFKVKDVSLNGIGIESDLYIKKGTILNLELKVEYDFPVFMKCRAENVFLENGKYKIGLSIKKVNKEFYLRFQNSISLYEHLS